MAESQDPNDSRPPDDDTHSENNDHHEPARKRQRIRLSCLECRRRKLSCSRELPCDRCVKSGTPERCTYESRPGQHVVTSAEKSSFSAVAPMVSFGGDVRRPAPNALVARQTGDQPALRDAARDHERIRRLELEVAQLRSVLSKQISVDGSTMAATPSTHKDSVKDTPPASNSALPVPVNADGLDLRFLRGNNFKTRYFGPHNVWSSLNELSGITPFMRETADEWLRPLNIQRKDRKKRKEDRDQKFLESDLGLEALLPSKEETDSLVTVYLDQFEQIHRIVHIPAFKKEYESFWDRTKPRVASFTALVLSMMAVSCCLDMQASNKFVGVKSNAFQTAEKWIKACGTWYDGQSAKHRKLVHYQIDCLLYLAKRVNVIKKKRFWTTAGAMVREGVVLGLHQDPDQVSAKINPYYSEMRRRLWATIVEFDLQASFDQGVPSLLSQVENNVNAPRNIDDDGFDENSDGLPLSLPATDYTFTSYQHFSRQSLPLRLELNRILTGPPIDLEWEQVLQYTDLITQEVDALPAWNLESEKGPEVSHKPMLAHTLLHLQLKQFLIPLHQPFLKMRKHNSRYQVAEFIYYNAARDMVIMHDQLYQKGIRTLYFLREDTMNAAMNLCNVFMHQPRESNGVIMANAQEALKLIEKCIVLKEDRVLRCGNNDPWGYSSMCAALGLLETHLGIKTSEAAKAAAAERFISLHYRLLSYQMTPLGQQEPENAASSSTQDPINRTNSITPFTMDTAPPAPSLGTTPLHRDGLPLSMPWLLPAADQSQMLVPNPDFNFEMLGSDLQDLWGDWGGGELP
ncbi:fungal-specific transcription factor domain-containing protein [Xylariomycetidae sp. FL2044]|nr:fungal-specific transcription factor domain-containing protein [Xylariomycetidae sp. FL2044]